MKDFSNNRAINHKHHESMEHDVNDGAKTNSQSKHEEGKGNQHKQKKETKKMKSIIKNSITPALAVFAVSMAIVLSLVFNAKKLDKNSYDKDIFAKTFSADSFTNDRADSDKTAFAKDNQRAAWKNIIDVDNDKNAPADFDKVGLVNDDRDNFFSFDKIKAYDIKANDSAGNAKVYDSDDKQCDGNGDRNFSKDKADQKLAKRTVGKSDNGFDNEVTQDNFDA